MFLHVGSLESATVFCLLTFKWSEFLGNHGSVWLGNMRLPSIEWEHESYPSYGDFAAVPFFAFFFPSVRFLLDRIVFEVLLTHPDPHKSPLFFFFKNIIQIAWFPYPGILQICLFNWLSMFNSSFLNCNWLWLCQKAARRLIFGQGQWEKHVGSEDATKRIQKFKESAWKCVYFLSAEALALAVTYNEPWFTNTKYFWVGPGDQVWPDQMIKLVA